MRYLAIDLGDKRTGLALGDDLLRLAAPAGLIEVPIDRGGGEDLLRAINDAVADQVGTGPCELIVGLPLNMDGTEGPRAVLSRAFAARIASRTGRVVHLVDERRTSLLADERMARSGLTHKQKKRRRDAIAAANILQIFLDSPDSCQPGSTPGG